MSFGGRAIEAVRRSGSALALGIDPRDADIPPAVKKRAREVLGDDAPKLRVRALEVMAFSRTLIQIAIDEKLAAVKLQSAFFEAAGPEGVLAFQDSLQALAAVDEDERPLAIADVKRGDIGSTAEAYAEAYMGADAPFPADAVTVSPFLGADTLAPWLAAAKKDRRAGIFVLVRTSNPGAADLQERVVGAGPANVSDLAAEIVDRLARETKDDSGYGAVGAVVGATAPGAAQRLRAAMPSAILLAPGVGAQGATAKDLAPFFDAEGLGALVPVSRGISGAWRDAGEVAWEDACRAAARRLKAEVAEAAKR